MRNVIRVLFVLPAALLSYQANACGSHGGCAIGFSSVRVVVSAPASCVTCRQVAPAYALPACPAGTVLQPIASPGIPSTGYAAPRVNPGVPTLGPSLGGPALPPPPTVVPKSPALSSNPSLPSPMPHGPIPSAAALPPPPSVSGLPNSGIAQPGYRYAQTATPTYACVPIASLYSANAGYAKAGFGYGGYGTGIGYGGGFGVYGRYRYGARYGFPAKRRVVVRSRTVVRSRGRLI